MQLRAEELGYSIRDIVSINSLTFSNRANATLYVYEDVVEDYRSAQYWQDFDIRTVKHASWTAADGNVWQYITGHIFGSDQTVAYIVGCSLPEGDVTVPAQVADGTNTYDVVGPVCESSDVFGRDCHLPLTQRGDLIAIRSAGAYGESMASRYNMRALPQAVFCTRR